MPVTECGCWIWVASTAREGYGSVYTPGETKNGTMSAHRASYKEFVGPIPDGLCVLHKCDTPPCINPEHLFLGTPADNARDRVAKGRQRLQGPNVVHNSAKLTEQNVKDILITLHTTDKSHLAIGRMFGASRQAISAISVGTSWRYIKRPGE